MDWPKNLQRAIRPSKTRSTAALWAKSLLNAVLFFSVFMLALPWLAHRLLPAALPVPEGLRVWLAVPLLFVGASAWLLCLDTFSRRGRGTPFPADAPSELVTSGLFAWSRNPIMAGELLVIWGIALWVGSWGVALYAALISGVAHAMVLCVEEPELRGRFGGAYDEYCRKVPRWFPGPRR